MTIYRVVSDGKFAELFPDVIGMTQKLQNRSEFLNANRTNSPLTPVWTAHEGIVEGKPPLADISRPDIHQLMLSTKSRENLETSLLELGEFLPVTHKGKDWHLFNILNTVQADEENCVINEYDEVEQVAFKNSDLEGQLLWTCSLENYGQIYCSQNFVDLVESAGLKGVCFEAA